MPLEEIVRVLERHEQEHLIAHLRRLDGRKQDELIRSLSEVDLAFLRRLHRKFCEDSPCPEARIEPAPIVSLPRTEAERARREEARRVGGELIRSGKVAVLIVAGGQGSRLGFDGPKGMFPISPVRQKPLFQHFAEAVQSVANRYGAEVPLLIMTSRENGETTRSFFAERKYFGLDPGGVHFFAQGTIPTLTPEGRLILQNETCLFANPDGHGGTLRALGSSGILEMLASRGIEEIFYCQVDNPLVKIADPVFLGYHRLEGAEISTKVVRRAGPEERVGVYGLLNSRPAIIEYSDMRPEDMRARDERGELLYWAGNTAIHAISVSFIRRLSAGGFGLPWHRAVKSAEGLNLEGNPCTLMAWKFETFIFDAIPLARKSCCLEVVREEEFAPVKNREGADSPETARRAINAQFRRWLENAGHRIKAEVSVEISPLFALDEEEVAQKLRGRKLIIEEDTYFG